MQKNAFYWLAFNGRFYLLQYKGETRFGHFFKSTSDNDTLFVGKKLLATANKVLWKVRK